MVAGDTLDDVVDRRVEVGKQLQALKICMVYARASV